MIASKFDVITVKQVDRVRKSGARGSLIKIACSWADLKPANLLLTRDLGTLKVADFGVAKKISRAARQDGYHAGNTGTYRYMAPEVICQQAGHYTEQCDIYSAAIVMWYIATVRRPPDNDVTRVEERPDILLVGWPSYAAVLQSMWQQDPDARPCASECIRALNALPDKPPAGAIAPS